MLRSSEVNIAAVSLGWPQSVAEGGETYARWYGWPSSSDAARYSCSHSTTWASAWGSVNAETRSRSEASRFSAGSSPSALPITNATGCAAPSQRSSCAANAALSNSRPRSSSATTRAPRGSLWRSRAPSAASSCVGGLPVARGSAFTVASSVAKRRGMRFRYSAHAACAQAGGLVPTATISRFAMRDLAGGLLQAHRLAAPDFLQVVIAAHRGMHDVHDDVAEVDEHPLGVRFPLDAVHAAAQLADALLHAVGERHDLARRVAAGDHHALEHRGEARGVEHDDVAPLDVFERLDHGALLRADIHQRYRR